MLSTKRHGDRARSQMVLALRTCLVAQIGCPQLRTCVVAQIGCYGHEPLPEKVTSRRVRAPTPRAGKESPIPRSTWRPAAVQAQHAEWPKFGDEAQEWELPEASQTPQIAIGRPHADPTPQKGGGTRCISSLRSSSWAGLR